MRLNQIYPRSDDMMTGLHRFEYETEILVLIFQLSRTQPRLPCVPGRTHLAAGQGGTKSCPHLKARK